MRRPRRPGGMVPPNVCETESHSEGRALRPRDITGVPFQHEDQGSVASESRKGGSCGGGNGGVIGMESSVIAQLRPEPYRQMSCGGDQCAFRSVGIIAQVAFVGGLHPAVMADAEVDDL